MLFNHRMSARRYLARVCARFLLLLGSFLLSAAVLADHPEEVELGISEYTEITDKLSVSKSKKESTSTTDHAELEELQGPFSSGPDVTRACLGCHNTAGHQFKKISTGHGIISIPKQGSSSERTISSIIFVPMPGAMKACVRSVMLDTT